jgi:hypothetical protein
MYDYKIVWLLHSNKPVVCLLFGFKPYWYKIKLKLDEKLI